jgi:glycosyltransferase involved in cell wall biosynthesis
MTVDVFVCTRNRSSALRNTLRSILRNSSHNIDVNVHVCDNGSHDDTNCVIKDVEFSQFHKFDEPSPGKSRCLNKMIAASGGEYLLFTDDDVIVPPDWIQQMISTAIVSKSDAVVGGVDIASEVIPSRWTDQHLAYYASTRHVALDYDHPFIGANYLVTRNVFNLVGGFNPLVGPGGIGHAEDTLFWLQCRKMQVKMIQARDIQVLHYPDVKRMNDAGIIALARKQGEFEAYVDYHWEQYARPHVLQSFIVRLVRLITSTSAYTLSKSHPDSVLTHAINIRKYYSAVYYMQYKSSRTHYSVRQGTHLDFCGDGAVSR